TRYFPTVTRPGINVETFWDGWFSASVNNGGLNDLQNVFAVRNGIEFVPDAFETDNTSGTASGITAAQLPALSVGARVVINELELGAVDSVELYNAGNAPATITGWRIVAAAPGFPTTTFVIPPFKLAPGTLIVLSEAAGVNTSSVLYFGNNISWNN